ncbi:acyl-CoA thioesterase II [Hydrogenophaga sp.]|uniref:acyl-CoA thioesterase n=1 Tax=Hydrogenophaga sp. TaxID=1904254 RepID=UPI002727C387|nr:acyl-CoA thioesterase domain-containing protein [Hydrogenophaga sp.]MDO8906591.1 thioesterase family protein [Hydrogenophaga sp.]
MSQAVWNEHNIEKLLKLEDLGGGRWRSCHGDANLNGRSYGGQLLGQAMMAALMEVPAGREASMMQFLFLQGAMPQESVDFQVTVLQEGKRFSSRHVRAAQGNGRTVLDAQVTCALPLDAPAHGTPSTAPAGERPEDLTPFCEVDPALLHNITLLGGYSQDRKPSIDFRIPDPERQLSSTHMNGRFRFWMRAAHALPDDVRVHSAAFAYLSDWWLNFSALGLHLRGLDGRALYISSLNHGLWLHRSILADQWMHVDCTSPCAAAGRGLSIGAVHDIEGRTLASMTQECLMAYAE